MDILLKEIYPYLVGLGSHYSKDSSEMDDMVQEALITIMEVDNRYHHLEKDHKLKLAKRSARNKIIDLVRSRNRYHLNYLPLEYFEDILQVNPIHEVEHKIRFEKFFKNSSSLDKEIILLKSQGFSIKEISKKLNLHQRRIYRVLKGGYYRYIDNTSSSTTVYNT